MNNSTLLASNAAEASNNWVLLFIATLLTGILLFFIGLYIGRRFWIRFEELNDRMHLDNKKRSALLNTQCEQFRTLRESVELR